MKTLFLHVWQSTPGGLKPTYLKDQGHDVLNPSLPDDVFEEAVSIAQQEFDQDKPDVVVGSSRAGAVAINIEVGIHQIGGWKWEEIIAAAYKQEGWSSVVFTSSSGDKGVNLIVEGEWGQLRFLGLDQVKAYSPDHLVGPSRVRDMGGVLHREQGATKGIITTTSDFTPQALRDAEHLFPRLELKPRDKLLTWLEALVSQEERHAFPSD